MQMLLCLPQKGRGNPGAAWSRGAGPISAPRLRLPAHRAPRQQQGSVARLLPK